MDSKPDEPRPRRRPLLIATIAVGAIVVGTVATVVAHNGAPGIAAPVELRSQPAANQAPGPAAQPAPPRHALPVPGQPHPKATDECFGTTPKPGSTPARPLCDWDRIFADTEARARALRQQQQAQFEERANELRRSADRGH